MLMGGPKFLKKKKGGSRANWKTRDESLEELSADVTGLDGQLIFLDAMPNHDDNECMIHISNPKYAFFPPPLRYKLCNLLRLWKDCCW